MKAALVQTRTPATPEAARDHVLPLVREAARQGAQLIVTPEGTNLLQKDRDKLLPQLRPLAEDLVVQALRDAARELRTSIVAGSVLVRRADGKAANRQVLIAPNGAIAATYDKLHMFDVDLPTGETARESATYAPGERAVVAEAAGARLGLSICYDIRFPALYRALALAGAEVLTVPAAFTRPTGQAHWEVLLRARAIETGSFVLAAAQGGFHEDGRGTWGHSLVVGPWGEVIAHLDHDEPGVLLAELDLSAAAKARRAIPALQNARQFPGTMIRYALICEHDHEFEGWFGSSADFDDQVARGLLDCPLCASKAVRKQIMAPAVSGTKRTAPPQDPRPTRAMMLEAMGALRRHVEENFDDVGDAFAKEARAIHEGKAEARGIYGQASPQDVRELVEDGVPVAPLPPEPPKKPQIN